MSAGPQRPARRQVATPVTGHEEVHAPGTVNIWTGRVLKEYRKPRENRRKEASQYRCLPKADAGQTRGTRAGAAYCCLYFARGICHHGPDCDFLHRLPTAADEERHNTDYSHDIFGRERGPASQDGRKKGVGSYERECRTLYAHYGGAGTLPIDKLRQIVADNFSEWGPLDSVHLVPPKTLAFVRYQWRSSAEFAKAAMHQQTLRGCDTSEILDVRWANEDPNPRAVARVQHEREVSLRDAYVKAVNNLPPDAKRARIQQLHLAATVRPGLASASYPDTDAQYGYKHHYEGWDAYQYQQQWEQYQHQGEQYQQQGEHLQQGEQYQQQEGEEGLQEDEEAQYHPQWAQGPEEGDEEAPENEEAKWAAWQQWQARQQQRGGSGGGHYLPLGGRAAAGEDSYARYLRPEDEWADRAAATGSGGQQQAQQAAQQQAQQDEAAADQAAQEALGLIGGYGSDSGGSEAAEDRGDEAAGTGGIGEAAEDQDGDAAQTGGSREAAGPGGGSDAKEQGDSEAEKQGGSREEAWPGASSGVAAEPGPSSGGTGEPEAGSGNAASGGGGTGKAGDDEEG